MPVEAPVLRIAGDDGESRQQVGEWREDDFQLGQLKLWKCHSSARHWHVCVLNQCEQITQSQLMCVYLVDVVNFGEASRGWRCVT